MLEQFTVEDYFVVALSVFVIVLSVAGSWLIG